MSAKPGVLPNHHKTLGRWQTVLIFITNQIGLGILTLPIVLRILGLIPGIIAIIGLGAVATYTSYIFGQFYKRHPHVMNIVDCCQEVGGKPLAWICAIAFELNLAMSCAAALKVMSIAFNTLSGHAMCTVWFIMIAMVACWVLCIPRKFRFIAKLGVPNTISIVAALLILMISLGVAGPRGAAPGRKPHIVLIGHPSFGDGLSACTDVAFAYAGSQGFISVMAEMKDPDRDYTPALVMLQSFTIPIYTVVAVVMYVLAGEHTQVIALMSALRLPAMVAFGVFLPCLLATAVILGHTAIKYLFVVTLRCKNAQDDYSKNTKRSWSLWTGIGTVFWVTSFVLANAIPNLGGTLDIIGSLFVAWLSFGMPSVFWLYLNWGLQRSSKRKMALAVMNWTIVGFTIFVNISGMWYTIRGMVRSSSTSKSVVFTCADNSLF